MSWLSIHSIAGGGTVAVTIAAVFYFLIHNPDKGKIVKAEIQNNADEEYLMPKVKPTTLEAASYL